MANDRTTARPEGLTTLEERFCEEYVVDYRAGPAYERAGGQAKRPRQQGYMLLKRPDIRARVDELIAEQAERTRITADRVMVELGHIAFANMADYVTIQPDGTAYVDLSELTRDQAAAIQEVIVDQVTGGVDEMGRPVKRVRVKLADKQRALELIGKRLKMFVEQHEVRNITLEQALDEIDAIAEGMHGENGHAEPDDA